MNFKKIAKVISAIVALAAVAAAVYMAVKKFTGKKKPEYFDDNDFFECDNEIEIVEAQPEEPAVEEAPVKEEAPKAKPAKKASKKKAE
jgi:hypothetical protein